MSFTYNINLSVFGTNAIDRLIAKLDTMEKEIVQVRSAVLGSSAVMQAGFSRVTTAVSSLDNRIRDTRRDVVGLGNDTRNTEGKMNSSFSGMKSGVGSLIAQIGLAAAAWKSLNTTADLDAAQRSITFASGEEGAANLAYIKKEVARLNVDLMGSLEGYKTLQGSLMGTGMEGIGRELFSGMAEASATLSMPRHAFELSLKAFGQMASKGVVMSEELKLQLGDHLPGALNIASRAMGVSTKDLMKMMEKGEVLASDFLPKMARELRRTFGEQAVMNSKSATAQFNILNNTLTKMYDTFGQKLLPSFTKFLNDYLIPGVAWLGDNIDAISALAVVLGTAAAAQWLLNIAMAANPVGAVVVAIGLLSLAFMDTYKSSATFRAEMSGLWEVFRNAGAALLMYIVTPLEVAAKLLTGLLNKDLGAIKDALLIAPTRGLELAKSLYEAPSDFRRGYDSKWQEDHKSKRDASGLFAFGSTPSAAAQEGPWASAFGASGAGATPPVNKDLAKGLTGINEGGRHSKVINITLGNMVEKLEINAATAEKGMDDMVEMLTRKLTQIINNANQLQTTF